MSNEINFVITLDGYTEGGATFTPHVSEEGVLSWTNDQGLPNPEPILIKGKAMTFDELTDEEKEELRGEPGPPGAVEFDALTPEQKAELKGDPFTYEDFTEEQLEALKVKGDPGEPGYTPQKNIDYFDGEPGKPGDPGEPGYSPVKGTDYWTANDKAEIIAEVFAQVVDGNEVAY